MPPVFILLNARAVSVNSPSITANAVKPLTNWPVSSAPSSFTGLARRLIATAINISPVAVLLRAFGLSFILSNTMQKAVSSPRRAPTPRRPFPMLSTSLRVLTARANSDMAMDIDIRPLVFAPPIKRDATPSSTNNPPIAPTAVANFFAGISANVEHDAANTPKDTAITKSCPTFNEVWN